MNAPVVCPTRPGTPSDAASPAPHPVLDRSPRLRERAQALALRCPEPAWLGWNARHRVVCAQGHEFTTAPAYLLRGLQGCPVCRDEACLQRLHAAALDRKAVCLDSVWHGYTAAYRFECQKGHAWQHDAGRVSCPTCTVAAEVQKRRLYNGLARLREAARAQGGECLSGEYLGQAARYSFRCAAGHAWHTAGSEVLRGAWCGPCANERTRTQRRLPDGLARLQEAAAAKGGACLSEAYAGSAQRYRFRCRHGHEWDAVGNRILRGSWCLACVESQKAERLRRPDGLARLQALATAQGGACLSTVYLGQAYRHRFRCGGGHEWEVIAASVFQGNWCGVCAHAVRRLGIEAARAAAHARGGQCLSPTYTNTATKMSWICERGHAWQARFSQIQRGQWCPSCAHMAQITNRHSKAWRRYRNAGHAAAT